MQENKALETMDDVKTKLHSLVLDIVDTVATFDGRLTYTSVDENGQCTLTFTSGPHIFDVTVQGKVYADHLVELTMFYPHGFPNEVLLHSVYKGALSRSQIHHQLGTRLAEWYGHTVRSQTRLLNDHDNPDTEEL